MNERVRPEIIAHRGDSARWPENTLSAFDAAIRAGCDWIELDVRLSRDGVPVVFHDERLERLAGRSGAVADCTAAELSRTVVRIPGRNSDEDERIPLYEDVLAAVGDAARLYVELKSDHRGEDDARALIEAVDARTPADTAHAFGSFDPRLVKHALRLGRPAILILDRMDALEALRDEELARLYALSVHEPLLSQGAVAAARTHGCLLWTWTIDDPDAMRAALRAGVDGICSNDVVAARRVAEEWSR